MAGHEFGNLTESGRVGGVVYDESQLSEAEARAAQPPKAPKPKVVAATVAGALVTLIVGILAMVGVEVPETVAAAAVTLLSALAAYFKVG